MINIHLISEHSVNAAIKYLQKMPVDGTKLFSITEYKERRNNKQNAFMWCDGLLGTISENGWLNGQQCEPRIWHELFKEKFLPELGDDDYDRMVMKDYRKWLHMPDGTRRLIGSTTGLTVFGMSVYNQKIEAYATSELGIELPENPNGR